MRDEHPILTLAEKIRTIAGSLKLSHEDFIQAKQKVSPHQRRP